MVEFLAFIVLVAIFFGVSLTTALYGTIKAILWIIGLSILYAMLSPALEKFWAWFTDVEPIKNTTKSTPTKKRTPNAKRNNIGGWIVIFIICYLITTIILYAFNIVETDGFDKLPIIIKILIPSLPFIAIFATLFIKNAINKKRASHKN